MTARILLAEDNLVNQRVAQKHLAYLGYGVDVVADGQAAVTALTQKDYELVFMDCQMAGLDGFAATAEIRRREGATRHTTIVALTAHALPGDRERCLAAGMDDYIAKPLRRTDFAAMLERWLPAAQHTEITAATNTTGFSLDILQQTIGWTREDDPELFVEIITLFCQGAEERLAAMRQAVAAADWEALKALGHAWRGSCSSLGVHRLEQLCRSLEETANNMQALQTKALVSELEHEFQRVKAVLAPVLE